MYNQIFGVTFITIIFGLVNKTIGEGSVNFLGCFEDGGPNNRLMTDHHQDFHGTLTPDKCNEHCRGKGFAYAGTQYSFECFCSIIKPPGGKKRSASDCNSKCAGDETKTCGGNNRVAVFSTGLEDPTEGSVNFLGCFEDGGPNNRLMTDHHQDFHGTLTPDKCNEHCRGKGFAYAGTQYSFECFCSIIKPPGGKKRLASDCNSKCAGDETKTCGGNNRVAVFSTGLEDPTGSAEEVLKPIGCFKDSDKNRLLEFRKDFPGSLTNQKCVTLCAKRGYRYAGVEYGRECYCGNKKPTFKAYTSDEECSKRCEGDVNQLCGGGWRIYVFKTSNAGQDDTAEAGKYIGCYTDREDSRSLDGHLEDFGGFLTPFKCTGLCYSKGFLYSGTQFSYQCFCGDKPPNPISKVAEEECNTPCTGDQNEMCGGQSRNSIRETGIPDLPVDGKYLGCFNDENNQIYKGVKLTFEQTNSPRRCMNYCSQLGYKYSGVEYGKECFCGNQEPRASLVVNSEECGTACSGDPEESCGANWRLAVYRTHFGESGGDRNTTPIRVPTPKPCQPSETVVAGKVSVCRGDVVFEEDFNTPLGNTWSHVVMIPDDPEVLEFEYAIFTADPENCFTRKNKLIIKPVLLNDTFVQSGHLQLTGCTGRAGTRQCELQASYYNIIPPLTTARIHTRESFSFRYGIVEIRAKLPLGDWLVPELWLEPRNHYYGPGYKSGRIRIAMNRGNSDYKCHEEDYGSNRLESGVVMGPSSNVQKRSLTTKLPDNWHDHFHNYTLIWSPDSISFKIDNGQAQELIPAGRTLCEVIGFKNDECLIWSGGSKIAPFDQDFYISLGLSVGSARDFPDDCINRGKVKPFKTTSFKAMLKFWQDKENWKATWTEEHSSLNIEHIRVIAL